MGASMLVDVGKDYFIILESAFSKACENLKEVKNFEFKLARSNIRIRTAGNSLGSFICRALMHLPQVSSNNECLEILVWDETETNIKLPNPPSQLFINENGESYYQNLFCHYFIIYYENKTIFHLYDLESNRAIVCIKDFKKLPNYFIAAPFFEIFKIWSKKVGLNILHAGCVSNNDHSILVVGKGGVGKSTTSIQSLIGGLKYISDDYVLVELSENPVAYSIYCSGKLHQSHLINFPKVSEIAFNENQDVYDKPLMFLNEVYRDQILLKSPVKGIVAPNLVDREYTDTETLSSFEALKSLAPSTLLQLRLGDGSDLEKMANLTRSTPCFRLNLGTNLGRIAPVVSDLLDSLE